MSLSSARVSPTLVQSTFIFTETVACSKDAYCNYRFYTPCSLFRPQNARKPSRVSRHISLGYRHRHRHQPPPTNGCSVVPQPAQAQPQPAGIKMDSVMTRRTWHHRRNCAVCCSALRSRESPPEEGVRMGTRVYHPWA